MVSVKTKAEAVAEIGRLIVAVGDHFNGGDDAERDYMAAHLPRGLAGRVGEMPTAAIHLLARIGEACSDGGQPVNIVGLAAQSGLLKGTVSKHVQRLVEAELVVRDPVPGNRKEIQLRPTDDGAELLGVHRRMHDEMDRGLRDFLLRYSASELATVTRVLDDLLHTERRGVALFTDTGR